MENIMDIKIIDRQFKVSPYNNLRYYLEVTLSDYVDYLWQEAYQEALHSVGQITSWRGSGAPVVDRISFEGNKIITHDFPEFAQNEVPDFIKELEKIIAMANMIYVSKQTLIRQKQEQEEKEKQERLKKLEEMNKKLNS